MVHWTERVLNLRPGDLGRGAPLFFYLFLVMTCNIAGKVARAALFLDRFSAKQLPYADIAIAVLMAFVVAGYLRISRHTSLRNLLVGSALFFAASCFLFWWLAHFYRFGWLYPAFYIWVGIFGVIAPMQVWTLANYALTTREAKRLFGLVGSGAIAGWIFAGYASKLVARRFGTETLLVGIALFLCICAALVALISKQRQQTLFAAEAAESPAERKHASLLESLRAVWSSSYLRAIAALICISSVVVTVTGWQFLAVTEQWIPQKDAMAAFFGDFSFYAGMLAIVAQLLLTGRFLGRFGIGSALFVLPLIVLGGSVGLLLSGTLVAAVILKGADQVLRYSLDKSTTELLYLPVPAEAKMQAKSFIDTVVWRAGDGLAGLTVLLFTTYLHWPAPRVSWAVLALVVGWLLAAFVARRNYVGTLRESIQKHRLDAERVSVPVLDRSTTELLAANLSAADPKEILYALSLLQAGRKTTLHPAVRDLLRHPAPEVKQKAISMLAAAGDKSIRPQVEQLLSDPDLGVRTEALLYLTYHAHVDPLAEIQEWSDLPDYSIRAAMAAFLARPGPAQNLETTELILDGMVKEAGAEGKAARLEAARLIGEMPDQFEAQLRQLTADPDPEVARHAIRSVGRLRARRLIPAILERLAEPELTPTIIEALSSLGDAIVGTLRDHLSDPELPLAVRRQIPDVLAHIGTQDAESALLENLLESNTALRFQVISALNNIHQRHPELRLDREMIETVLVAEIMGHYRSYQILGTLGASLESDEAVVRALGDSMNQEVERIFRLLKLMFPQYDFHSACFGLLQSSSRAVHDNALEFLENVLKPQLRHLLVPLLDKDVTIGERVHVANRTVGAKVESREEAAAALVTSEDPWLKSCGAYAIGTLGLKSLEGELDKCLAHPDPLLRETARHAKLRLSR